MPRSLVQDVTNNFSGGLITQATGLNFPPNTCSESLNCIHHELGFVQRRPGFDFEENFSTKTINRTSSVVNTYFWRNVTGDGTTNLVVSQVGNSLYFYLPDNTFGFSQGALATTVDLTDFQPVSAPDPSLAECQYATGLGYLFVTHPTLEPFYVSYDIITQVVTSTQINVRVRDTEGEDDGLAVDERISVFVTNTKHLYNLNNQGWYVGFGGGAPIVLYATATGVYPSNSEAWWQYKNFDDVFDVTTIDTVMFPRAQEAPKGHFLYDAFNIDRTANSGVTITNSGFQRPQAVAFFAGRVWYAGTSANGYESKVYFSQILKDVGDAGDCFSREDPTSPDFDMLEADDGGWLVMPGVGLVYKMVAMGATLVVFGTQGIYQIGGSVGSGFTALDYSSSFLSSVKAVSATSFVDVDGTPAWWTIEGIYMLVPNGNSLQVQSLTDQKIKTLFLDIPLTCKRLARGAYDPRSHTIQWIYREAVPTSLTQSYEFTHILNFNTLSGAFYPWTLAENAAVAVNAIFLTEGFGAAANVTDVVIGADDVIITPSDVVLIDYGSAVLDFANKFFVSYPDSGSYKFTFADFSNTDYVEWLKYYDTAALDYDSFFTTAPNIVPSQGSKKFESNYIYLFSDLREIGETDFYFTPIWNYANSGNSGKIPNRQRVSRTLGYFDNVRNRMKVRGVGYAVQYKFESIAGKPFHIIGYTVSESVVTRD